MPTSGHSRSAAAPSDRFATTRWSIVVAAGRQQEPQARAALEQLCAAYWYPVYAYVRRRGHSPDDAADLTQAFFAELLEKESLAAADRERGRFRAFLLTLLKRFLSHERERAAALKRGGGRKPLSFDVVSAEDRYRIEPSHESTPERLFERRWAMTVLEQALQRLEAEHAARGRSAQFDQLKVFLTGSSGLPPYGEIASRLGMTETAVKVAVHRLRQRYRDLLRQEVAGTVDQAESVDEELSGLLRALSNEA